MSKFLKLDGNHNDIKSYLLENQISVFDACRFGNGCTDLFTYNTENLETGFLEIKREGKGGHFYRAQIDFMAKWFGSVQYTNDKAHALQFAREPHRYGLSQEDKEKLKELLKEDKSDKFAVRKINQLLGRT